ncbi:MAG: GDP-mannose 4,6-dehydratase, partial [Candidatus Micrarchaeota archaeon]
GDICDKATVRKSIQGIDNVIHLAAIASVPRSVEKPEETNRVNAGGTVNLLFESSRAEVEKFIYASSSAVYGNLPVLPKRESSPLAPISPYASTKLAGEHFCSLFEHNFGLKTLSFRYFNIYGPKQDPQSEYAAVIPKFMELMKNEKRPTIFGDGRQTRDFTYVKDAIKANKLALESKATGAFNIANGEEKSLNELVEILNAILGKRLSPIYESVRAGDIKHSFADISKARKAISYKPEWSLEKGLSDMQKER